MNILELKIGKFTESVRCAIIEKNYYAALTVALILPDICSKIEFPNKSTNLRYPNWFDQFVKDKYTMKKPMHHVFLSGNDAYALRCSFLHQGETDITSKKQEEVLPILYL